MREDRYFSPNPQQKALARCLYGLVKKAPIVSPHGHVSPKIFSLADYRFPDPVALLFQSDHYILRMLYSQGISYETLLSRENPRQVWGVFAENYHLFRGTPSGVWMDHQLEHLFGITEKLDKSNAGEVYERIEAQLAAEDFTPRKLFHRFGIEVLATTDSACDPLDDHKAIHQSDWLGRVIPTFRIDDLLDIDHKDWVEKVQQLSRISGVTIHSFEGFVTAIEHRRSAFKALGATASDISMKEPRSIKLGSNEVKRIFISGLRGQATPAEAAQFSAHMLYELARMSCEDGLVLQIHAGVFRNHNPQVDAQFGPDMGFDIPIAVEFTNNLFPLLRDFGNHPNLHLILFTLDESCYSRELAPLAGAYPTVKLGPPWWFLDSLNGIRRYFETVMETAGVYNTSGFVDDVRTLVAIPARHDVWRRTSADWLAGLILRGVIDEHDAEDLIWALAADLAKAAYKL